MATFTSVLCDTSHHQTVYDNRIYARTTMTTRKYSSTTPPFHSHLSLAPIPSIDLSENLLGDGKVNDDVGSATSSSYINSSEHYDNAFLNTYDNPIGYLESDNAHQFLVNFPYDNLELYRDTIEQEDKIVQEKRELYAHSPTRNQSPVLVYLENKNLALCICLISFLLIGVIGLGVFLLNKIFRPITLNTLPQEYDDPWNLSSATLETTPSLPMIFTRQSMIDLAALTTTSIATIENTSPSTTVCPTDRWGSRCENICKPCGLGVCHPNTGECICPPDIYGEFCDLWKVDDTPKRGDMTT